MLLEPFFLNGSAVETLGYEGFSKVRDYAKVVKKLAEEYNFTFVPLQEKFNQMADKQHRITRCFLFIKGRAFKYYKRKIYIGNM